MEGRERGRRAPFRLTPLARGVKPKQLAQVLAEAANRLNRSRKATFLLAGVLAESEEGMPMKEGPLAGADRAVLKKIRQAGKELRKWQIHSKDVADTLQVAARDMKTVQPYVFFEQSVFASLDWKAPNVQ